MVEGNDPPIIYVNEYSKKDLVKVKRFATAKRVKVLITVGRWYDSQTFSLVARNDTLRAKFIDNLLNLVRNNTKPVLEEPNGWGLDGINLDWQGPGIATAKCNGFSSNYSANYLILLKELRAALIREFGDGQKLLTAVVRNKPFDGPDGKPMNNVSEYAKYFDFVNIMAINIMGSWSNTPGPNAPFKANIAKGGDPFSFTQAIDDWLAAGFPSSKLTAGLAFHGRTLKAKTDMNETLENMYQTKESETPKGNSSNSNKYNLFCNEETFDSGVHGYKYLRQHYLSSPTTPTNGYIRHYDNFTKTPWLFHSQKLEFISYDDPDSLKVRVAYAKEKNLRGVTYWDMAQDYNDELLNVAIQIRDDTNSSVPTSQQSL